MKKNTSWKFTDELSVTFQSSVSGPGEFGPRCQCQTNFLDTGSMKYIKQNQMSWPFVMIASVVSAIKCSDRRADK